MKNRKNEKVLTNNATQIKRRNQIMKKNENKGKKQIMKKERKKEDIMKINEKERKRRNKKMKNRETEGKK